MRWYLKIKSSQFLQNHHLKGMKATNRCFLLSHRSFNLWKSPLCLVLYGVPPEQEPAYLYISCLITKSYYPNIHFPILYTFQSFELQVKLYFTQLLSLLAIMSLQQYYLEPIHTDLLIGVQLVETLRSTKELHYALQVYLQAHVDLRQY